MKKNGFKPRMSSKLLIFNCFHNRQTLSLSFMAPGFVQ